MTNIRRLIWVYNVCSGMSAEYVNYGNWIKSTTPPTSNESSWTRPCAGQPAAHLRKLGSPDYPQSVQ